MLERIFWWGSVLVISSKVFAVVSSRYWGAVFLVVSSKSSPGFFSVFWGWAFLKVWISSRMF